MKNSLTAKMHRELFIKRMMQLFLFLSIIAVIVFLITNVAFAAFDPFAAINGFKLTLASLFEAIGIIVALVGVFIFVMSLLSHDPSQKIIGITAIIAGFVLAGASALIDYMIAAGNNG